MDEGDSDMSKLKRFFMFATGIALVVLYFYSFSVLGSTLNDDFSCLDVEPDLTCGIFGNELDSTLRSLRTLVLWGLIANISAFVLFTLRRFSGPMSMMYGSGIWSILILVVTMAGFCLAALATGVVFAGRLTFLKDNAVLDDWSYVGDVQLIAGLQWWTFIVYIVLALAGHAYSPRRAKTDPSYERMQQHVAHEHWVPPPVPHSQQPQMHHSQHAAAVCTVVHPANGPRMMTGY